MLASFLDLRVDTAGFFVGDAWAKVAVIEKFPVRDGSKKNVKMSWS